MMYYDRLHIQRITLPQALSDGPIFIPSVCDCFTSMIAQDVGYKAMCLTGEDFGAYMGMPDIGLITPTELRIMEGQISKVTNIPMIIDMAGGFGNETNAVRSAVDMIESGAMAVIMNDQVFPNRYGNEHSSKYLTEVGFGNKTRAVADTLAGSQGVLISRTDCLKDLGIDAAIARCKVAVENGAYMTSIKDLDNADEIKRFAAEVPGKKMISLGYELDKRPLSYDELTALGFDIVLCPTFVDAAYCAYEKQLLQAAECQNDFFVDPVDIINGTERRVFLGLGSWLEFGKRYNPEINIASKTKALD